MYRFSAKRSVKGYTLIEVLVSLAVLSLCMLLVTRGFFSSASAIKQLNNRLSALLLIESEKWALTQRIRRGFIIDKSDNREKIGDSPAFYVNSSIERKTGFENLYDLHISVNWEEAGKDLSLTGDVYKRAGL